MPRMLRLETFETRPMEGGEITLDADALEETRLAAFEQGYQAGWDDAAAAQSEDQETLRADIARNLQALSFTFHDARAHLLKGLTPLVDQICARVVPDVAASAIGAIVRESLQPHIDAAADRPVTIVLNPTSRPRVEGVLSAGPAPPYIISEEPTLGAGQVLLRFDDGGDQRIDLDAAVDEIASAVGAFFDQTGAEAPAQTDIEDQQEISANG
ncbi:flagellar biosynthesis protein [Alkalilacustris brevis]|uniref:FliH/SctL family protein n=1 Tax=Alkalilacustris brevis TaxID=2026338 RepID=UPI00192E64D4|nr:flagellar biosynthesis protein [Alkalilacustris brevis]